MSGQPSDETTRFVNPPSPQLIQTLTELELVHRRDFARCSGYVRQFARDLPTFDSVWVDGLVRNGSLSQFQARQIQAGQAESLRAGPWIILDRIQSATRIEVFQARHAQNGQRATLSRLAASFDDVVASNERLEGLLSTWAPVRSKLSSPPEGQFVESNAWWVVSPEQAGISLDSLLIRRGRFPAAVVQLIAARLSHELNELHRLNSIHGDLRPANIRLSTRGQLALSHHGVLQTLEPGRPLLAKLPLEYFDSLAPERIETELDGRSLLSAEVYALGCLLWQLLVGRSPYPMADPLLKMSAHRSQKIPPVRDWAPETPVPLAALIDQATQRDPALRPTMQQVVSRLAIPATTGRDRLVRFLNSFESASSRPLVQQDLIAELPRAWKVTGQATAVTASLALLGAGLFWGPGLWSAAPIGPPQAAATTSDGNAGTLNGNVTHDDSTTSLDTTTPIVTAEANAPLMDVLLDLPAPDNQGRVVLSGKRYRASAITSPHKLIIVGSADAPAEIIIEAEPLALVASQVSLSNIHITCESILPQPSIQVTAQDLQLHQVRLTSEHASTAAMLDWSLGNTADVTAGHLHVSDSIFVAAGDLLALNFPLQSASFENVLQAGGGSLLSLHRGVRAGARVPLVLNNCTLRSTGAPIRWLLEEAPPSGQLSLQGRDSILAMRPETALVEFTAGRVSADWEQHLQIAAEGLILEEQAPIVGYRYANDSREFRLMTPKVMQVDGLLTGSVEFSGPNLRSPADSLIRTANIPLRQANQQLGFDAAAIR